MGFWENVNLGKLVSNGNAFIFEAGGLGFKSRDGQIRHGVANGSPPFNISSKKAVLLWRND